jgi:MOSC domain-containing protein YiiM
VLEEGLVAAGDPVELLAADPQRVSVGDMVRPVYFDEPDPAGTEKALAIRTLSGGLRASLHVRLGGSS